MATIKEIAEKCGVSEQAIRGWCKRNQVAKDERKAYVLSQEEETSIYAYYKGESAKGERKGERKGKESCESKVSHDEGIIELLEKQMQMLQKELEQKDKQINDLTERLTESHKLLDQQQQLNGQLNKLLEKKEPEPEFIEYPEEPERKKHWWNKK